jgi:extracellular elastinolytic metalloproteinase
VINNYPNAPVGGSLQTVDFTTPGWLPGGAATLSGPNVHAYSDVNDDDVAQASEEIGPDGTGNWNYGITFFNNSANCTASFPCLWEQTLANSWQTNRPHGGTNLFYLNNKYHDYLEAAPIGFTPAAGNFEGDDPVVAQDIDGADTAGGLPDGNHVNNANMATPPDGFSPRMQMFLFRNPLVETSSSDDANIVYHEYTHGLSNRLVVDALGNSTLGGGQSGAMGEAWSDWYALDLLVGEGSETDTPTDGDVVVGKYVTLGPGIRFQGMDCPVGSASPNCPGGFFTGPGGFTYGDFGLVGGVPEVHDDGEIWEETLWDLRGALGVPLTRSLVTRAMELSPGNPSFLDMRNSILQADLVATGGANRAAIWNVFATRGMGYFSAAINGDDVGPVEDFAQPPAAKSPTAKLQGTITDFDSNQVLTGAMVAFAGHASGFQGDLVGASNGEGFYQVKKIFLGTYPKVVASKPGWDAVVAEVQVVKGENIRNFILRRDWASIFGGGEVTAFDGPDYTIFGCGPGAAIDQSLGIGWGSDASVNAENNPFATPKSITIKLPVTVDVSEIAIDPAHTCGDAGSAATKDFRLETSPDGVNWTLASTGMFQRADRGRLNSVPLAANSKADVRYVRFTMINPMVPNPDNSLPPFGQDAMALRCGPDPPFSGNFSGCRFMDMSEIEVYGLQN